jgi:serine/threonine protein kinase
MHSAEMGKRNELGRMAWRAPEITTKTTTKPSFASDVNSLGVCIIEAVTGKRPWSEFSNDEVRDFHNKGTSPPIHKPEAMTSEQWALVERMIAFRRGERPDLGEVMNP